MVGGGAGFEAGRHSRPVAAAWIHRDEHAAEPKQVRVRWIFSMRLVLYLVVTEKSILMHLPPEEGAHELAAAIPMSLHRPSPAIDHFVVQPGLGLKAVQDAVGQVHAPDGPEATETLGTFLFRGREFGPPNVTCLALAARAADFASMPSVVHEDGGSAGCGERAKGRKAWASAVFTHPHGLEVQLCESRDSKEPGNNVKNVRR